MPPPSILPKRRRTTPSASSGSLPGPSGESKRLAAHRIHIIFLVDNSGSMQINNRISHVFDAIHLFLNAFTGMDDVVCSLAIFDDIFEVKFRRRKANSNLQALLQEVRATNVLRGTGRYLKALEAMRSLIAEGMNVGILLSDGEPTEVLWEERSPACIEEVIVGMRREFGNMCILHTVGFGAFDTSCLRNLAVAGGGTFHDSRAIDGAKLRSIFGMLCTSVSTLRSTLLAFGEEASKPLPARELEPPDVWRTASPKELQEMSQPCWAWPMLESTESQSGDLVPRGEGKKMFLHRKPFAQGGLRYAFHFRSGRSYSQEDERGKDMHLVVKESKFATKHKSPEDVHKFFLENHRRAQVFALAFNQAVASIAVDGLRDSRAAKVEFVPAYVMQISDASAESGLRYVTAERYIPGTYVKFNGNDGFVETAVGGDAAAVAAAFSHFTFVHTCGDELCVDVQGVGTLWTDPQIHSVTKRYGVADLGQNGMQRFFESHMCSKLCLLLQLRSVSSETLKLGEPVRPPQLCVVCLVGERVGLCKPCRHLCICLQCIRSVEQLSRCPICRQELAGIEVVSLAAGAHAEMRVK